MGVEWHARASYGQWQPQKNHIISHFWIDFEEKNTLSKEKLLWHKEMCELGSRKSSKLVLSLQN